ncbi:DUF3307 domain-containing protein [Kitasatospora sp. NPDC093550]|uniref:DUF3307 domain-containing protein n=1 Tax=Kitasatospora sp. NPDC093550 TaxID=3364089 RepID=UPI00381D827F
MNAAATVAFPAIFVLLYAAHLASDYPLQTDHQAAHKAGSGRTGWAANVAHAVTHVTVSLVLLMVGEWVLDLHISAAAAVVGPLWIGISHSVIDRRWPVARWMSWARQAGFAQHGGAAHVDQTFHVVLGLLPAALILAAL